MELVGCKTPLSKRSEIAMAAGRCQGGEAKADSFAAVLQSVSMERVFAFDVADVPARDKSAQPAQYFAAIAAGI